MKANKANIIHPELSYQVMGAIFEVHKSLCPGFLESIYKKALIDELVNIGLNVEIEKTFPVVYKGKKIGTHRVDLVVENTIIIELKTVERFSVHHTAQVRSYLKASGLKLGILVNFSKNKMEYRRVLIR